MKGLIGILGGIVAAATANKSLLLNEAKNDQSNIPLVIASIPDIPDRTIAVLYNGPSPLPKMSEYLKLLERAGTERIVFSCNTARFWLPPLKKECEVQILSIVDATMLDVIETGYTNIGLLATETTLFSCINKDTIENAGFKCISPTKGNQSLIIESVYNLKVGYITKARGIMVKQCEYIFNDGGDVIILGCTEIFIILSEEIAQKLVIISTLQKS